MSKRNTLLSAAAAVVLFGVVGAAQAATFVRTYEAPGVQTADSVTFTFKGVETLDGHGTGSQSFTTDFGLGGALTGDFSTFRLRSADQYGGAGGTGAYLALYGSDIATLDLSRPGGGGVNYLGFWLSALNGGNTVTFYDNGVQVAQYDASTVFNGIPNLDAYKCSPVPAFAGQNCGEPYAFVNFERTDGFFDKVVFSQASGGGLEIDNITVGLTTGAVPEPATWAMMIGGFGAIGAVLRRRRARSLA